MELTPQLVTLKAVAKKIPDNYGLVTSMDEAFSIRDMLLASNDPIAFDIETGYTGPDLAKHSLNMFSPKQFISGFSITNDPRWARYFPIHHDFYESNLPDVELWELFRPVFETKHIICHNFAFEALNLRMLGTKLNIAPIEIPNYDDTMVMSYVLASTMYHGLKELTRVHFDHKMTEITDLFPKMTHPQQECLRFNILDLTPEVVNYACEDSKWTLLLYMLFNKALELENEGVHTIAGIEHEITRILIDMREPGITVDWDEFNSSYQEFFRFDHTMDAYVRRLFSEAVGRDISDVNFKSVKQMRKLLFEDMGLTSERRTKGNELSTDETSLVLLGQQHAAPAALIRHRQTNKNGGFLKTWKNYEGNPDNLIHPALNQVRIGSGRFACSDPNVQNITKNWFFSTTEVGPFGDSDDKLYQAYAMSQDPDTFWTGNARNFLVARPGYTFLSYDVSQGELRVLAGLADEPYLKQAFEDKVDIHSATAAQMFKIPLTKVTPALRARGKTINFALVYQQGVKAMAEALKISVEEAKSLQSAYFSAFSNVNSWIANQIVQGRRDGFTTTFMGRKVTIWELQSDNPAVVRKGDRLLINVPVQGGLADIVKVSMINCANILKAEGLWGDKVLMVMNQHDSLVFEVHNSLDLRDIQALLLPGVEFPIEGFPTFVSDWSYGTQYGAMKDFSSYGKEEINKPKVLNLAMNLSTAKGGSIDTIKSVLGSGDEWQVNLTFPETSADTHFLGTTDSRNLLSLAEIQGVELSVQTNK